MSGPMRSDGDEGAGHAEEERGELGGGDDEEGGVEVEAGEGGEDLGGVFDVGPVLADVGSAKNHELAGEEAEEDGDEDLEGEEEDGAADVGGGECGTGAGAVHLEPVLEGEQQGEGGEEADDGDDAEQHAEGGGLLDVEVGHIAAVVTDGEVLVDEGLDAEVEGAEVGDGGGEGEPLAEAGGAVTVEEEGGEGDLLEDGDEMRGEARR